MASRTFRVAIIGDTPRGRYGHWLDQGEENYGLVAGNELNAYYAFEDGGSRFPAYYAFEDGGSRLPHRRSPRLPPAARR